LILSDQISRGNSINSEKRAKLIRKYIEKINNS